ncbi:high mobility group box domain-containing protein, partial [Ochromonadaceae sp. CCMP2298]
PKRFKSAYICFVMEKMDSLKQQLPSDLKVTEIMKRLAYMWRTLPPLERREYELVAEADKARYFEELAGYSGPMQVPNKRQKKDP